MSTTDQRRISLEEAAKIMFQTAEPTPQQILKIKSLIERGALAGNTQGRWTTSPESVARYLAMAAMHKNESGGKKGGQLERTSRQRTSEAHIRPLYSDMLKDYFLAVLRRRDARRRSKVFHRAVRAGQLVGITLILGLCFWIVSASSEPPVEFDVVEAYLTKTNPGVQIEQWYPATSAPSGGGYRIRVKYQFQQPNGTYTAQDLVFTVKDAQVRGIAPAPPEAADQTVE